MKIYSEQAIFIQKVPIAARAVVEIEDAYAARLIAQKIVRAATSDEIEAAGELSAEPVKETTMIETEATQAAKVEGEQ